MKRWNAWKGGLLTIRAAAVMLMFLTVGLGAPRSVVADDPPPSCEDYTIDECLYPWVCEDLAGSNCGGARGEQCEDLGYVACVDLPVQQCSQGGAMLCLFDGDGGGGGID